MGDEKRQESILCHFEKSWANPLAGLHFKWVMEDPFTGSTMQSVVRRFLGAFKGHSEKKCKKKCGKAPKMGRPIFVGTHTPLFGQGVMGILGSMRVDGLCQASCGISLAGQRLWQFARTSLPEWPANPTH